MSKTPWTPGPWEVLPLQDGRRAIYTDAESGFIGDVFGWEEDDPEQAEANACLIAAAPEMAELLEQTMIGIGMGWDLDGYLLQIKELLARIRGDAT